MTDELKERISLALNENQESAAIKRINRFIPVLRREAMDAYRKLFPDQVEQLNVNEITAALAYLSGEIMGHYCPYEQIPEAAGILVMHLRKGVTDAATLEDEPKEQ